MTHYTIYVENDTTEGYSLVRLGYAEGGGPQAAARAWFAQDGNGKRLEDNAVLVAIPTGNHNVLTPKVETQPRLRF